jgi:transglutaminase-like putative cysteine protease
MRLRIEHRTSFVYDDLITEALTEVRLHPVDADGQNVHSFQLNTDPRAQVMDYVDRFGNDVSHFNVLSPLSRLSVVSVSEVSTVSDYAPFHRPIDPLDRFDFLSATRYAPDTERLRGFAAPHVHTDDAHATALNLMHAIYDAFDYVPGATTVTTSAEQVLELERGVCQDFAHTLIALCRINGMPARYVSGYLYGPRLAERDDAASHAWVDVYIENHGWISLDPTHNCPQNERYVRLGIGRDYADVPPTRGTYKGKAKETLEVKVNVREI